ncbi:MAG: sodium ion-translocating decarboxylase subunit beta [Deltaproteobacteria bacterium]|nr:sodium ion-translocating decarboxylase subunit beta [Deltaproteobacteria bacterium]
MDLIGVVFIYIAIKKHYEPLLLIPIGFGILLGNVPPILIAGEHVFYTSVTNPNSQMYFLYYGVLKGIYPPLIFLGIGALTDFSYLISNPRLILLGAAAQFGIFVTYFGALQLGFSPAHAGSIGIIGGADGPTAIFLSSMLAPELIAPIAIAAYSYMALVPVIQPPIMKLLTTREERLIRMKPPREVSRVERIMFPVSTFVICTLLAPGSAILLGMLMFGNLLRESGVTERLAQTARTSFVDIITILIGICVGCSASADTFLKPTSLKIFALGAGSFMIATASGVIFGKIMNRLGKEPLNPLIGAAGVSAVPDSARVVQMVGNEEDPTNFLLMHAMGPNVAGVIGSAIAAGVLWSVLT